MDNKNKFSKSLLSSAILAATLKTLSSPAIASNCPPVNASGNVHVASGAFCNGGITVNSGSSINDIGLEGKVVGNITNNDTISDFWMDFGTLDGSFINNDVADTAHVANGSEIYADIRNNGDMRYITITDGPGAATKVHGSVVNTGYIESIYIEGMGTHIGGDLVNADSAIIEDELRITNGATIEGDVHNNGSIDDLLVKSASIEGNVINNGVVFELSIDDKSFVGKNLTNNGDAFIVELRDQSAIDGSMVNTGNSVVMAAEGGAIIGQDFGNEGVVDGIMVLDGGTVEGDFYSSATAYTDGMLLIDGAVVKGDLINAGVSNSIALIEDETRVDGNLINDGLLDGIIQLRKNAYVGGDLVNNGSIFVGPNNSLYVNASTVAGIVIDDSIVGDSVVNTGNISVAFPPPAPPAPPTSPPVVDGITPLPDTMVSLDHSIAGISVDNSSAVGDIVNTGSIEVTAGFEHDGVEFQNGVYANGIQVVNGSTSGNIINDGMILADTFGIYVDGADYDGITVDGSIVNADGGGILTQDNGVFIQHAQVTGDVINSGLINSANDNAIDIEDSIIGGSVVNTGNLITNEKYDTVDIDNSIIGGDIINTVTGQITGEDGLDVDNSMVSGSIANAGFIIADDEGMDIDDTNLGGDLANTGVIIAGRVGIHLEGDDLAPMAGPSELIMDNEYISIGGNFIHSGEITSGSTGIHMEYVDIAGDFNAYKGFIEAGFLEDGQLATGIELSDVNINGNMLLGEINASESGISFERGTVGGDFAVLGSISAMQGEGIYLRDVDIKGAFFNEGNINAGDDGIDISNVTIAESFYNAGNITTGDKGIRLYGNYSNEDGVIVHDVVTTIASDFHNSGDIIAVGDHGISIDDASIVGDFINTGDITTGDGNSKYAINIEGYSHIGGDVINTGNLTGGKGIRLNGNAYLKDDELTDGSIVTVEGGLFNNGDITSTNDAMRLVGVDLGGSLINVGVIRNSGSDAIDINDAIIRGNIENHGTINTTSSDAIDVRNTLVQGHIINTGTIDSTGSRGINIGHQGVVTGSILNSTDGVIVADSDTLSIRNSSINGHIINDGTMIARDKNAIEIDTSAIDGSIINNGILRSGDNAVEVKKSSVSGNIENHGSIFAIEGDGVSSQGGNGYKITDTEVEGSLLNTGTIIANGDGYFVEGSRTWYEEQEVGDGMPPGGYYALEPVTIGGRFANTGEIEAGSNGLDFELVSIGSNGITEDGQSDFVNEGNILAQNGSAMDLRATSIAGDLINTGELTAQREDQAFTPYTIHETSDDYYRGISLTGMLYGEELVRSDIAGSFSNSGNITGLDQGIYIHNSDIGGSVINNGNITSGRATGIDIAEATIGGGFVNYGDIDSRANFLLQEGAHYRATWGGTPLMDGDVVLQAQGQDEAGNFWFVVRNESTDQRTVALQEQSGDFATESFSIDSGEEVFINTGQLEGILDLNADGNSLLTSTSAQTNNFIPVTIDEQHGISLTNITVESGIANVGNIMSSGNGINLQNVSANENLINEGTIDAGQTAIKVAGNVTLDGFINSGDLSGEDGIELTSNASMDTFDGTFILNTDDGVITLGSGGFVNSGNITADENGINLKGVILGGGILNTGDITTEDDNAIELDDVIVNGNIENYGMLSVSDEGRDGIDLEYVVVKGSVMNFGEMNISGTEAFDIENSIIEGDIVNGVDGVLHADSDVFYIRNTYIQGDLINQGDIVAERHDGIDVQVGTTGFEGNRILTSIGGSLINTGNIIAGDNGFEVDGEWRYGYTTESLDGEVVIPGQIDKLEIGGVLYNSGDIFAEDTGMDLELVSVGTNGSLADGQANFENHGNIMAGQDAAIKVVASDIAGDFINSGDLTVESAEQYSEGSQYYRYVGDATADGSITLTAVGTDDTGNTWFRIKNDSDQFMVTSLVNESGSFDAGSMGIDAGQELYITVGANNTDTENYVLSNFSGENTSEEDLLGQAVVDLETTFQPAYQVATDLESLRGISISGEVYDEGDETEQLIKSSVGGSFLNAGNITATGEGIYINQADIGGDFANSGDIKSLTASAIDINNIIAGGNFENIADLTAGEAANSGYQEGDSYRQVWAGVPSDDGGIVMVAKGFDDNGNQWFVIRNERSFTSNDLRLEEFEGDFSTSSFSLASGEELYINAGELEGSLELQSPWYENVLAAESGISDNFSPEYYEANGIKIADASFGGHFLNEGAISSLDEGIYLENATFGAGIKNSGNVTSGATGVELTNVTSSGGLLNSGNINAGSEGIFIADSTLDGGVSNEGDITAIGSGLHISNGLLNGSVVNAGSIAVSSLDDGYSAGMQLHSVDGVGAFVNQGTINVEGNSYSAGMGAGNVNMDGVVANLGAINSSTFGIALNNVQGATGLVNDGVITSVSSGIEVANSSINGDVINTEDGQIIVESNETSNNAAISLDAVTDINNIINQGTITALEGSWGNTGIRATDIFMNGMIGNAGTITVDGVGLEMFGVNGVTDLINEGTINSGRESILLIDSSMDGDLINSTTGIINSDQMGIVLGEANNINSLQNHGVINSYEMDGILIFDTSLKEDLLNTGDITAGRNAISLFGVNVENVVNSGNITAGTYVPMQSDGESELPSPSFASDQAVGDGIALMGVDVNGFVTNQGSINAVTHGMLIQDDSTTKGIMNFGSVIAGEDAIRIRNVNVIQEDGDASMMTGHIINGDDGIIIAGDDAIRIYDSKIEGNIENRGMVTADENAIDIDESYIGGNIINYGTMTSAKTGVELGSVDADGMMSIDGSIINQGIINAGSAGVFSGIAATKVNVDGMLGNSGNINSSGSAMTVENANVGEGIYNSGTIIANTVGINISADTTEYRVDSLMNTGTITAENGAAVQVIGSSIGQVINTGTINGGLVTVDTEIANDIEINPTSVVAFDFRAAGSSLDLLNGSAEDGNTGIINGGIYGSAFSNDLITISSGMLEGDIVDVEDIRVTGLATLNNNIFSFNNDSTLTVEGSGILDMGVTNNINIEGDYIQEGSFNEEGLPAGGDLSIAVNINERSYDNAWIEATGNAELGEGSTVTVSVVDRNIGNLDTTDGGADMLIVKADSDSDGSGRVFNNGANLSFVGSAQSILLNVEDYISNDGTEYGTRISIADLGGLAGNGGADANAANALATLQGVNSAGLVEMYESNPDLYNAIYDGSEASLAALAERIIASPEEGIAAGQAAQAEAVNTILTRIAELRTGASGISAGDEGDADSNIRPDSLWIRAIHSDGKQKATSSNGNDFNGYALRSSGFTIGADKDINDYLTLGAGVSMMTSTANEQGNNAQQANSETDTYLGSLYGGWRDQDYFVDASVNFGKGGTDLKGSDWEANYDSMQLGLSIMAGKSFLFNNNDSLIEPRVGFNYTRLETDSYSYQSNGENITVGSQNLETLELGAGLRFVTGIEIGDGLLLPEASMMAWHDFKADDVKANVEFETGGGSFTYFGPEAEKTRYQIGVGAEYLMDNNFTVSINYDYNWQDGFKADTVVAKLRYDF